MRYIFLLPFFMLTSLTAMESKSIVTLWAIHNVLLQPSSPTDMLPSRFIPSTLDPKKLESELLEAVAANSAYTNAYAQKHPGTMHPAMKAWLLDLENGANMKKLARENISWWTQPLLYQVAGAAFSPKSAASHLTPVAKAVALAKACQTDGHITALASNWNSESFSEIETQHADVVSLFSHKFISGQRKKLTMDPIFFEDIKNELGTKHSYYYIDVSKGTGNESLAAAKNAGVIPIAVTTPEKLETDLRALKLLS